MATKRRSRRAARAALLAAEDRPIRLELSDPTRTSLWSGLAVGLSVAVLIGAVGVAIYFAVRRRSSQTQGLAGAPVPQPIVYTLPPGGGPAIQVAPETMAAVVTPSADPAAPASQPQPPLDTRALNTVYRSFLRPEDNSFMRTYLMPPISATQIASVRVAQAIQNPAAVVVRVVGGTAGTDFGVFSKDPTELTRDGIAATPAGDVFIVPSGQASEVRLMPREVLYAKGSTTGLLASITSTETISRIAM